MEDTFHSECNFEDVEGEFHTELDTQHRPVITHLAFRGTTSASKDIEVDSAAIYRLAISLDTEK